MTTTQLTDALRIASQRGLLPTSLGSEELRQAYANSLIKASVISARTANLDYLAKIKAVIDRLINGGYDNDKPKLRLELKQTLQALDYTPEGGFPTDLAGSVPPAEKGSLQDLGSNRRLNLILDTQQQLVTGKSQQLQGFDHIALKYAPAWELVRIAWRRVPRGIDEGSIAWPQRWVQAGGIITFDGGRSRMIALKTSPVWEELGSSSLFDDALDTEHPPFAFNSGMGWLPVSLSECLRLGIDVGGQVPPKATAESVAIAKPVFDVSKLGDDFGEVADKWFADFEAEHGGGAE